MHWRHGAWSRPAEAAAGFCKTFARHGCTMVVPGMDGCTNKQHHSTGSSPNNLLVQMKNACRCHGARIAGENASLVMTHTSSSLRIRSNILTNDIMQTCPFTYQRMGAVFFSTDQFTYEDDGPADEERGRAAAAAAPRHGRAAVVQATEKPHREEEDDCFQNNPSQNL
ncbi:inactive beta-amylase 9-like [Miscanthus floridulus]|uniref:inactive beta-amylase 9-like n=1 Tax=Miscanthus floridulus TaxID=154761 RepID=UPI00345A509D